jgi:hypothetical protein
MSKAAQEVQRMVDELKKSRRAKATERERVGNVELAAKPRRRKSDAKATTRAKVKTAGGRTVKTYTLVDGVPDKVRNPSKARTLLSTIYINGKVTANDLRALLGKKFAEPTLRFYLGKYQRENVIKTL